MTSSLFWKSRLGALSANNTRLPLKPVYQGHISCMKNGKGTESTLPKGWDSNTIGCLDRCSCVSHLCCARSLWHIYFGTLLGSIFLFCSGSGHTTTCRSQQREHVTGSNRTKKHNCFLKARFGKTPINAQNLFQSQETNTYSLNPGSLMPSVHQRATVVSIRNWSKCVLIAWPAVYVTQSSLLLAYVGHVMFWKRSDVLSGSWQIFHRTTFSSLPCTCNGSHRMYLPRPCSSLMRHEFSCQDWTISAASWGLQWCREDGNLVGRLTNQFRSLRIKPLWDETNKFEPLQFFELAFSAIHQKRGDNRNVPLKESKNLKKQGSNMFQHVQKAEAVLWHLGKQCSNKPWSTTWAQCAALLQPVKVLHLKKFGYTALNLKVQQGIICRMEKKPRNPASENCAERLESLSLSRFSRLYRPKSNIAACLSSRV